jgi:hypothetical protein
MAEYVKRDPFSRTTLVREKETVGTVQGALLATCAYCGNVKWRKGKSGMPTSPYLWRYSVESDTGHAHYDGRLFCSASCRKCYNM